MSRRKDSVLGILANCRKVYLLGENMPVHGKKFMRKIVSILLSGEVTRRGRPTFYLFTLECGHIKREHHSPRVFVQTFSFRELLNKEGIISAMQNFPTKMHCYECAEGKAESPKCKRTKLPTGVMPFLGYCKQNCTQEQLANCMNKDIEWTEK